MDRAHRLIIALLAVLIFGGGAWFVYRLYIHPPMAVRAEQRQLARAEQAAETPDDPSAAAFADALAATEEAPPEATRARWKQFLAEHPDSPQAPEARARLGPLNMAALFAEEPGEETAVHTVVRGDSLSRIARQQGTTIDLLARANHLGGTMLQIGQQLVIPRVEITATIDRQARVLRLHNRGEFLREYPLLAAAVPGVPEGGTAEVRVVDTIVESDGRRVTFGQNGYPAGQRTILLSPPAGAITAAEPADETAAGLVVKKQDMGEIFVLLRRGVPVTIE